MSVARFKKSFFRLAAVVLALSAFATARAQAPSAVQVFMPNGERPPRELRFTLSRDDGRVDVLFTDSKGKFQLTGDLNRDREYTITFDGDGRTYETTTASIRLLRGSVTYVPVYLRPYKGARRASGLPDVPNFDANVPENARGHYNQALRFINTGDRERAIAELKRALDGYPDYLSALNDLGVLYLKSDRLNEAAKAFRRAAQIDKRFQVARLNLGIVLNRQRKFSEAEGILRVLYEQNPGMPGLRLALADALIGSTRLDAARSVLAEAVADPKLDTASQVEANYKLAVALSRAEKHAEAIAALEKAVQLDPNAANAHLLLGASLLELKRYAEAERELIKAYELGGRETANANLFLGQLYLSQQKNELALRAFKQYVKDVPNAPNLAKIQETINSLENLLTKKQ